MDLLVHIIDDDDLVAGSLERMVSKKGHRAVVSATGTEALRRIRENVPDLVLLDLSLPDMNGIEVLKEIQQINPCVTVIMISGYGTVETAVDALKLGAWDFLTKPLNLTKVHSLIDNVFAQVRLRTEVQYVRDEQQNAFLAQHVIGKSPLIQKCYSLAKSAAENDRLSILITGESGTGKEFLARYVHYHSPRSTKPLVTVNCSALPRELVESELFGYEKGAFTGASMSGKQGRFELAHQGTLFLDEIGDLHSEAQAKILRFLQEKELQRVGSPHTRQLDVRIIAATNKDLEESVREGTFREDLYYRLNVLRIHLPPLRDRREDLSLFAMHFLNAFNQEFGKRILGFSPEAQNSLLRYPWPGNIRELRNVIERAVHLAPGPYLTEQHLMIGTEASIPSSSSSNKRRHLSLREMEREYVKSVLASMKGNKSQTAAALEISRARLRRIISGTE